MDDWGPIAAWRRWRERRRFNSQGGDSSDACDLGCDGCDVISDGCDGCDACDCNLMISLGAFLTALPVLRSAPTLRGRPRVTVPGRGGLAMIRAYQATISPHLPTRCRYEPSCSEYGAQAVRKYGLVDGSRLAAARIHRCNSAVPLRTPDPLQ